MGQTCAWKSGEGRGRGRGGGVEWTKEDHFQTVPACLLAYDKRERGLAVDRDKQWEEQPRPPLDQYQRHPVSGAGETAIDFCHHDDPSDCQTLELEKCERS